MIIYTTQIFYKHFTGSIFENNLYFELLHDLNAAESSTEKLNLDIVYIYLRAYK